MIVRQNQQALSVGGVIDGTRFFAGSLVWPESGWALAVMILSAWLLPRASLTSITNGCPMFLLRGIVDGTNCGMGAAEPAHATRAVTGVLVGFITFYSLRWIAG